VVAVVVVCDYFHYFKHLGKEVEDQLQAQSGGSCCISKRCRGERPLLPGLHALYVVISS
jgi:hypothetical protein